MSLFLRFDGFGGLAPWQLQVRSARLHFNEVAISE